HLRQDVLGAPLRSVDRARQVALAAVGVATEKDLRPPDVLAALLQVPAHRAPLAGSQHPSGIPRRFPQGLVSAAGGVRFMASDEAFQLVPPAGIEPAAHGLGNRCSIPLSYEAETLVESLDERQPPGRDVSCAHDFTNSIGR